MIERTWEYGTQKRVVVLQMSGEFQMVREIDNPAEAHVLLGSARDLTCKEGQTGTITFMEGGPTGAYWKFVADK